MFTPAATIRPSIFFTSIPFGSHDGSLNCESPSISLAVPLGADQDFNVVEDFGTGTTSLRHFFLMTSGGVVNATYLVNFLMLTLYYLLSTVSMALDTAAVSISLLCLSTSHAISITSSLMGAYLCSAGLHNLDPI